jgi:hypothetical protein
MTELGRESKINVAYFKSSGVVGSLEATWNALPRDHRDSALHLDCTRLAYVDVPGMIFLLARLIERVRSGRSTTIALPKEDRVIRALRAWNFDTTIERACGMPFDMLLDSDSEQTWHAWQSVPRTYNEELLPAKYFPIQAAIRASTEFTPSLAADWSDSWRSSYLLSVLDKMLDGHGSRVASHIIHEAIMNGVRHPGAKILLAASSSRSYFGKATGREQSRHLTICVWDDGDAIPHTLARMATRVSSFIPRQNALFRRRIVLRKLAGENGPEHLTSLSNQDPILSSSPAHILLLASVFPGITSDLDAKRGYAHEDVMVEDAEFSLPGMGLFVLCTTVCEVFKGKVTIRSDNLRMSVEQIKVGKDECPALDVKITEVLGSAPVLGNQLTVRIPRQFLAAEKQIAKVNSMYVDDTS